MSTIHIQNWKTGHNNIVICAKNDDEPDLVGIAYAVTPEQYEDAKRYGSGLCLAHPLYNEAETEVIFLGLGNVYRACGQQGGI